MPFVILIAIWLHLVFAWLPRGQRWSMSVLCYIQFQWSCQKNMSLKKHILLSLMNTFHRRIFFIKITIELTCDGSCHLIKNSKRYIQFRENFIFLCKMDNIRTSLTECALVTSSTVTRITVHGISTGRSILAWVTGTLVGILKVKKNMN